MQKAILSAVFALAASGVVCAEKCIRQGEFGLEADAEVEIKDGSVVLTVKNTLEKDVYVPTSFESKNTRIGTYFLHADGGLVSFPNDFEILKPGKTRQYTFKLEDPIRAGAECEFTIWAPLREAGENWRTIKKSGNVVYEVVGKLTKGKDQ